MIRIPSILIEYTVTMISFLVQKYQQTSVFLRLTTQLFWVLFIHRKHNFWNKWPLTLTLYWNILSPILTSFRQKMWTKIINRLTARICLWSSAIWESAYMACTHLSENEMNRCPLCVQAMCQFSKGYTGAVRFWSNWILRKHQVAGIGDSWP